MYRMLNEFYDGVLHVRRVKFMTQIARYPHTCFLETVENVPDAK